MDKDNDFVILQVILNEHKRKGYISKKLFDYFTHNCTIIDKQLISKNPDGSQTYLIQMFDNIDDNDSYYLDYNNRNLYLGEYLKLEINVIDNPEIEWKELYKSLGKDLKFAGKTEEARYELLKEIILGLQIKANSLDLFEEKLTSFKKYLISDGAPDYFMDYIKSIEEQIEHLKAEREVIKKATIKKIVEKTKTIKYNYNILFYKLPKSKYKPKEKNSFKKYNFVFVDKKEDIRNLDTFDIIVTNKENSSLEKEFNNIFFYDNDSLDIENLYVNCLDDVIILTEELQKDDYKKILVDQLAVTDNEWYKNAIGKRMFVIDNDGFGQYNPLGFLNLEKDPLWEMDLKEIPKFKGVTITKKWKEEVSEKAPQIPEQDFVNMLSLKEANINTLKNFLNGVDINKNSDIKTGYNKLKEFISDKISNVSL